jgi:DNA-binding response OmpR family regulator
MKILVVDDEALNRRLLRAILEKEPGTIVFEAEDGLKALAMVGGESIDLVLLDLMMPGIDGYETCRRLKETSPHIPVIIISAISDQDEIHGRVAESGADDILLKPINRSLLLERIRALPHK